MRIAVIDDENIFRMQLSMIIKKIAEAKDLDLPVDGFEDGPSFIEALDSARYDVVFMDIFMPDMDGIATATRMREICSDNYLVFTTASNEHYPDAFSLHAFEYVTKPFDLDRISHVMDEIIARSPMDAAFIRIAEGSLEEKLYLRDILAVTTDGHYLNIYLNRNDSVRTRMTSSEFLKASGEDARFLVINRGIIINMDFVKGIEDTDVVLTDGSMYPITTKKINSTIQQIKEYQFRNQ